MKNKYFLLLISCALSFSSFSQWQAIDSTSNGSFQCLHFMNRDTGFAFNDWATLRRTTDGGSSWDTVSIAFDSYMFDMDFANGNVGYAVGGAWFPFNKYYANSIMKTLDGGLTWDSVYGNTSGGVFYAVEVISPQEFYAVGDYMMVHSTDGGITLDTITLSTPLESYSKIEFVNTQHGYMLGHTYIQSQTYLNRLYETTNGGNSWQVVYSDTLGYQGFTDFVINASGDGILIGEKGQIRSKQAGSAWSIVPLADTSLVFVRSEMADGRVYAIGDNGIVNELYETSDFGNTWTSQALPVDSNDYVTGMSFPGGGVGYFAGYTKIYKNSALISLTENVIHGFEVFPNPASEYLQLQLPSDAINVSVSIVNILGQSIEEHTLTESSARIDVSTFAKGTYFLVYKVGAKAVSAKKFIIYH